MEEPPGQGFVRFFRSLFHKKHALGNHSDLAEEMHGLMDEGQAKGLISDEESDMVFGVLELRETKAQSIMIPRIEISSASIEATLGEVIALVNACGHTRIPIHRNSVDDIVGILHAKDLLRLWGHDPGMPLPLDILRKPFFAPRGQLTGELLRELRARKTHMAILTDEYGGTAGIITIEDIVEEIVGDIMDEHDTEEPLLSVQDDGSILVDARLEADEMADYLKVDLPEGDFESVGGLVIQLFGGIPEKGACIPFHDFDITVKEADQRRIDKVLITPRTTTGSALSSELSS